MTGTDSKGKDVSVDWTMQMGYIDKKDITETNMSYNMTNQLGLNPTKPSGDASIDDRSFLQTVVQTTSLPDLTLELSYMFDATATDGQAGKFFFGGTADDYASAVNQDVPFS